MSSGDEHDWLEALAGRGGTDTPGAAAAEGRFLRRALLAARERSARTSAAESGDAVARIDPAREQALIERAVREGLIGRPRRAAGWRPLLAAAALAALSFGIAWTLWAPGDVDVVRSAPDGTVRLEARDPPGLQRRILAELRAAGVEASAYEALDAQGIDADLPQPLPPAVARVLAVHGIPAPADGVLRIEIREQR